MISKDKEIIKYSKYKLLYMRICFIVEFFISGILGIYILNGKRTNINGMYSWSSLLVELVCISLLGAITIINTYVLKMKIEKIFLTLVIPIGFLFIFSILPFQVPDEPAHIIRAYEVYNGEFISRIDDDGKHRAIVPIGLAEINLSNMNKYENIFNKLGEKTVYEETSEVYTEAQSYIGVVYIFSGLAMKIGQLFNFNIIISIYLARIANFVLFLFLSYYSIKIVPFGKKVTSAFFLMPMLLQQACSVSPDSVINSVILLFITYVLKISFTEKRISNTVVLFFLFIGCFLGVAKIVYFPIICLTSFIMYNKSISTKKKILIIAVSVILSVAIGLLWYGYQTRYIDERNYVHEQNVNAKEQINFIIHNVPKYFFKLYVHVKATFSHYILELIGYHLGWAEIIVNKWYIYLYLAVLVILPFIEKNHYSFDRLQQLIVWVIIISVSLLIITGLYLVWSEVGSDEIRGVQGRYFIPIAILPFLSLCSKKRKIDIKYMEYICFLVIVLVDLRVINIIQNFFS